MKQVWANIKWWVAAVPIAAFLYGVIDQGIQVVTAANDVPDIKQSVEKLTNLTEEAISFNIFLRNHLIANGIDEAIAKKWSGIPVGPQHDSAGSLILYEQYLAQDSLLVRGLLLMDSEDGTDTLKELWRFRTADEDDGQ